MFQREAEGLFWFLRSAESFNSCKVMLRSHSNSCHRTVYGANSGTAVGIYDNYGIEALCVRSTRKAFPLAA